MELTKEMINCLKIRYIKFDGWYGSCLNCEIDIQDKVIRGENNVCIIAIDCKKWLEEQEKLLNR